MQGIPFAKEKLLLQRKRIHTECLHSYSFSLTSSISREYTHTHAQNGENILFLHCNIPSACISCLSHTFVTDLKGNAAFMLIKSE